MDKILERASYFGFGSFLTICGLALIGDVIASIDHIESSISGLKFDASGYTNFDVLPGNINGQFGRLAMTMGGLSNLLVGLAYIIRAAKK
jgi:hypothetical protein